MRERFEPQVNALKKDMELRGRASNVLQVAFQETVDQGVLSAEDATEALEVARHAITEEDTPVPEKLIQVGLDAACMYLQSSGMYSEELAAQLLDRTRTLALPSIQHKHE